MSTIDRGRQQIAREDAREFPIALDHSAKLRLRVIAEETGRDVYDLIRSAAEEAALDYFRRRADDPARTCPPDRT